MNVKVLVFFLMCLGGPVWAQGFAGLGTTAEGFAVPRRGAALQFPQDHGAHPEYRIEWWYLTANLTGEDGRDYGVQWTLFRSALEPRSASGWQDPQLWLGHAALTTPDAHYFAEKLGRGGVGQAGANANPFEAWIDDWQIAGDLTGQARITAGGKDFDYDLNLSATGPLVRHGDEGYSVKSASGQASFYYSQPFFDVSGQIDLPGGPVQVAGQAWLDREWSSQPLAADQDGWDWVSLHFDSGEKLMGFRLRQADGANYVSGTWIAPDGHVTPIGNTSGLTLTPVAEHQSPGGRVPVTWNITFPERGLDVTVQAVYPDAWMALGFAYWEGPVRISGTHAGRGYLEMTGYD